MLRPAHPALTPFVHRLWSHPAAATAGGASAAGREHVLPSGYLHLVIRLDGPPLRRVDPLSGDLIEYGPAVVAGIRDRFYAKQVGDPSSSVGVQLRAGAARALFGVAADELAGRHVPLDDLLGRTAGLLRDHLHSEPSETRRLAVLEAFLAQRLQAARTPQPVVLEAIAALAAGDAVAVVVRRSGFSHRHLGERFVDAVGLTPKRFQRVLRFQQVLRLAHGQSGRSWAEIAHRAGYSDQAHFNREFRAFAGVSPGSWRRAEPRHRHHLPIG